MKKLLRFVKRSIRVKIDKYNDGWAIKIRYRKR